jgi:hypothetical protein
VSVLMFDVLGEFEWYRDKKGYRIAPFNSVAPEALWKQSPDANVPWIVPNGKAEAAIRYRPFAQGGDLCAAFAAVTTPEALARFVNDHGLLTWSGFHFFHPNDPAFKDFPAGEPVRLGLAAAEMFRELLQFRASSNFRKLASHFQSKIAGFVGGGQTGIVELLPDPERGIRLKISPPTLLGALWYQLALKLSDATLRACPLCNRVFEVGRGTGLRADARFCCQEHKVQYFNQNRRTRKHR